MRLFLDLDLEKAKPSARAPKPPAAKEASSVIDAGGNDNKPGEVSAQPPTANQAKKPSARAPKPAAKEAAAPDTAAESEKAQTDATAPGGDKTSTGTAGSKKQMVDCPLGQDDCVRNGGTGRHREGSPLLMKHQAKAAKKGASGAGAEQQQQPSPDDGPVAEEHETPIDSNSVPGQKQAQHEQTMSPEAQATHQQHMQEYLSGSRDQEHHKMIHAMTVNEHRQNASKFRKQGNAALAQAHEQAALQKPRLKDVSGVKAYENTPPAERKYNSSYLDSYISHASRYLNGGPGGHPSNKFSEVHGMSIAEHEDMANKMEAAGAQSSANRHRRIAAMKDTFDEKEKGMLARRDAESRAAAEAKANKAAASGGKKGKEKDTSAHGQIQEMGSNMMSHLTYNHDMDPEEKAELLKVAKHAKETHDKGDATEEDVARIKGMAGRYGDSPYTGGKTKPGQRYLSKFSNEALEDHAQFAEAVGDHDLAKRYRNASQRNTENKNMAEAKAQAKANKEAAKATAQADKQAKRAESAEAKRIAAAPDLPADHGEYTAHAKSKAGQLKDFLNGPAQLEDHDRAKLEEAHKVISAHASLDSPATASQRRELRDATAIADKHMNNANYKQLADDEEDKQNQKRGASLASTFNKWWGHGAQIEQASDKDQATGALASRVPHMAAGAIVHATDHPLEGNTKSEEEDTTTTETKGKHEDYSPTKKDDQKKESNVNKGLYLDLSKAAQLSNAGVDSPDDDKAAEEDEHISRKRMVGTSPVNSDDATKSILYDMSSMLKSMRNNLLSQMDKSVNTDSEYKFLVEKGFSTNEAKYNTELLNKGFIRKEYDNWLMSKLEKSLSSRV
jgi:hypothetical protein